MSNGDKITTHCPNCSSTLTVAAIHAGKRLKCPKCQSIVDASISKDVSHNDKSRTSFDSRQVSGVLESSQPQASPRKQAEAAVLLSIAAVGGLLTVFLITFYASRLLRRDATPAPTEEFTATNADENANLDAVPRQAELDPIPDPPAPKREPEIASPESLWRETFDELNRQISESESSMRVELDPLHEEFTKWMDELKSGPRSFPREELLVKAEEAAEKIKLLMTQHELKSANFVREYVAALRDAAVPDSIAEELELKVISDAILRMDNTTNENAAVLKRYRDGGPSIMQTRRGRMWVMYNVRVEL